MCQQKQRATGQCVPMGLLGQKGPKRQRPTHQGPGGCGSRWRGMAQRRTTLFTSREGMKPAGIMCISNVRSICLSANLSVCLFVCLSGLSSNLYLLRFVPVNSIGFANQRDMADFGINMLCLYTHTYYIYTYELCMSIHIYICISINLHTIYVCIQIFICILFVFIYFMSTTSN